MGKEQLRYLTVEEWKKLDRSVKGRDRLLLRLLYETGCAVKEVVQLRCRDVDLKSNSLYFPDKRESFVSTKTMTLIVKLCDLQKKDRYLLPTRQSGVMSTKRVTQLVQGHCEAVGIMDAKPKLLRYTHIVHAYMKDVPLEEIQRQIGLRRSRAIELFSQLPDKPRKLAYKRFLE